MSELSGIKDVDRVILEKLDDRELLKACSLDKYTWNNVCDDAFLRRRLLSKYPQIAQYKLETETWKRFFLRAVNYIALMKEKFNYLYTFGDFVTQYDLLKQYSKDKNDLLIESSEVGELALVIWSLKTGADIHYRNDYALIWASKNGHLETVKYLVEFGADIHAHDDYALRWASKNGYLETVKYLVDSGANIHALNDRALIWASENGHLETVKYLVKAGADIHSENDEALIWSSLNGHLEIVKYLVEAGADIHINDDAPLRRANENGHLEVVNYLKSKM